MCSSRIGEAEHIPGCNMAFLRAALEAVGGFDRQFRVAGDDVDLCWRLQARGWEARIQPAAQFGTIRETLPDLLEASSGATEGPTRCWKRNGPKNIIWPDI